MLQDSLVLGFRVGISFGGLVRALDGVFSAGAFLCFCRGFWEKRVVERGFLMVNSWWDCGDFVVN
jgi:hypothetical protein